MALVADCRIFTDDVLICLLRVQDLLFPSGEYQGDLLLPLSLASRQLCGRCAIQRLLVFAAVLACKFSHCKRRSVQKDLWQIFWG